MLHHIYNPMLYIPLPNQSVISLENKNLHGLLTFLESLHAAVSPPILFSKSWDKWATRLICRDMDATLPQRVVSIIVSCKGHGKVRQERIITRVVKQKWQLKADIMTQAAGNRKIQVLRLCVILALGESEFSG